MITPDGKGLAALQAFVQEVNRKYKADETFSYDTFIKDTPITADDVRGMLDAGFLTRDNSGRGGRNYVYQWHKSTLSTNLIKEIQKARREYVKKRKAAQRLNLPFTASTMNMNENKSSRFTENADTLEQVKQLKKDIDLHWEEKKHFPIYSYCHDNFNWSPYYVRGLATSNTVTKHPDPNSGSQSLWEWTGESEVTMKTIRNIRKSLTKNSKKQNKKQRSKAKPVQKEDPIPTPEKTVQEVREVKEVKETPKPTKPAKQEPAIEPVVNVNSKPKIPISVDVTTEGDKKTVTIKIQI